MLASGAVKPETPTPPAEAAPPEMPSASERKAEFVTKVHDDACGTFGTVLGPNANDAHKNHFHLDMKARSRRAFCQ